MSCPICHSTHPPEPTVIRTGHPYRDLCEHPGGQRAYVQRRTCDPAKVEICTRCGQLVS